MKTLLKTFVLTLLLAVFALPVQAQALLGESNTAAAFEATPVEQVQESQLQEIIFLGWNTDADLTSSAARLLDVALDHPNEGTRAMAVIGLHAVGNEAEMFKLIRAVDAETSPKVRSIMVSTLNDFFNERYTDDDPAYVHASLLNGQ